MQDEFWMIFGLFEPHMHHEGMRHLPISTGVGQISIFFKFGPSLQTLVTDRDLSTTDDLICFVKNTKQQINSFDTDN